jgi:hypothetical protein
MFTGWFKDMVEGYGYRASVFVLFASGAARDG